MRLCKSVLKYVSLDCLVSFQIGVLCAYSGVSQIYSPALPSYFIKVLATLFAGNAVIGRHTLDSIR